MKKFAAIVLSLALVASVALASAGTIVIGATSVPHAEILEHVKPILADQGVDLEIIVYEDYTELNPRLADGDLKANYFQHVPYLNSYNKDHGTNLAPLGAVHYEPMGIYAGKTAALDALTSGAVIGIPNDESNETRAIELLAALDIIKLPAEYSSLTKLDIYGDLNPNKVELVEIAAAQLPAMLADFDFAVINSNYALQAGTAVVGTALASESEEVAYPNVIAVRSDDIADADLVTLINVLQGEETVAWITETYGTAVIPTSTY